MGTGSGQREDPRCSLCVEPAVIYLRYAKRHLCRTHLIKDIEQRVLLTIENNKLISTGDRIAVALSGGKDSTALLILLCRLLPALKDVSLVAITIDEGITGYREDTVHSAEVLTRRLGIEHHCISFTEQFGNPLDDLLKGRESQACSICGILRKKALNIGAHRVGATKLATGHNLDDEAQSVLMNVLRGDLPRLVRNSGNDSSGAFIQRIKPLAYISEKEIATYLMLNDAWTNLPECPYTRYALRREVKTMLTILEYRYPGTMLRLMESKKKVEHYCEVSMVCEPIRSCRECGDPCSGDICQVCLLRHSSGL